MSDREISDLPTRWSAIEADQLYRSSPGQLVTFSQDQISLGGLYDSLGKHLKAINKGIVPPRGNTGLVPSEETDYDLKSKILGKGGDRRFHAKMVDEVLHFSGKMTTH